MQLWPGLWEVYSPPPPGPACRLSQIRLTAAAALAHGTFGLGAKLLSRAPLMGIACASDAPERCSSDAGRGSPGTPVASNDGAWA